MKKLFYFAFPILAASSVQAAVNLPYTNDFSVDDGNFSSFGTPTWTVGGGVYTNSSPGAGAALASASTVQVNRSVNQDFVMTSQFNVTTASTSYSFGFSALGSTAATTGATGGGLFILADVSNTGAIRVLRFTSATGTEIVANELGVGTVGGTGIGTVNTSESYTLTLTGTYTGSNLLLTFQVFDGTNTRTVSGTTTAMNGDYFGFRDRNNSTTNAPLVLTADNFSIIPEPSSALLMGAGLAGFLVRRRR